ncbi:uncharacterized protein EKO05_0008583 [Ascochyta rabiei]|uniref:uncharacterized protein n=1 Tax=Didymella rabiei TaxID=5454 RepID=UPI002205C96C|nr:uncharacterized protein EKO05_0008583 [Ascochyta rabiei]UPX18279.1 hypothetical protein EKO05_0008583 [Ascochyta rabiei]
MSFAQTLWASLVQQYSYFVFTAPMDEDRIGQLEQRQDTWQSQQQPPHSHQPQLSDLRLQYPQHLHSQSAGQSGFHAARTPLQDSETWRYGTVSSHESRGGYLADQQAQYQVPQLIASTSPSWSPSGCVPPFVMGHGQVSSTHWAHSGGGAYECSQAQQLQQQYERPRQHDGWIVQQTCSSHAQHDTAAQSGYLGPDGVPFDLREAGLQGQVDHETAAGPYHEHWPIYTGPRSNSYKAFYGAYKPLDEEPVSSGRPPHDAQKATVNSVSKNLPYCSDNNNDEEESKTALVRYSPESSTSRFQSYRGRREDEYLQWDEQYGFGFAVSPPKAQPLRAARTRPAGGDYKYTSKGIGERRSKKVNSLSFSQARFDDGEELGDVRFGSNTASPSQNSPRTAEKYISHAHDHTKQDQSPRESGIQTSERPWQPAFHHVRADRTLRPTTEPTFARPVFHKPMQLFEHSVEPGGILQTNAQTVRSRAAAGIHGLRSAHVPRCPPQRSAKDVRDAHKQHVPVTDLKELVEGITLPADKQKAFDTACDQGVYKEATQTSSKKDCAFEEQALLESKLSGCVYHGSREELARFPRKALPSRRRIHRRTTTESMPPSPPWKRTRGESSSPQDGSDIQPKPAAGPTPTPSRATGLWDKFAAHIAQDDKKMAVKAREEVERLKRERFRPELRETHKDKKGKKERVVQERVSGSTSAGIRSQSAGGKKEKKQTGGGGVLVDEAYDTDSSDGGIALSPSDLEPDSWVVVKTGDESKGWETRVLLASGC